MGRGQGYCSLLSHAKGSPHKIKYLVRTVHDATVQTNRTKCSVTDDVESKDRNKLTRNKKTMGLNFKGVVNDWMAKWSSRIDV